MSRQWLRGGALLLVLGLAFSGTAAHADEGETATEDPGDSSGGSDGSGGIYAAAWGSTVTFEGAVEGDGREAGNLGVVSSDWEPPPCWHAPWLGARDFKAEVKPKHQDALNDEDIKGTFRTAVGQVVAHYEDGYDFPGKPGYEDYNVEHDGEGMFWTAVPNPAEPDALKRNSCNEMPYWVENGEPPPPYAEDEAIKPHMLAGLAYERMQVPETEAELRPAGEQTVNLPTWVWLDGAGIQPVSVTARVPALGMWATTTATPVSVTIDPGTEDAKLHPDGGECAIGDDGRVGRPYRRGDADRLPPCGVTYLRSTESTGPYEFTASVTWQVTWSASDGTEDEPLPSGVIEDSVELEVREIQTVVR